MRKSSILLSATLLGLICTAQLQSKWLIIKNATSIPVWVYVDRASNNLLMIGKYHSSKAYPKLIKPGRDARNFWYTGKTSVHWTHDSGKTPGVPGAPGTSVPPEQRNWYETPYFGNIKYVRIDEDGTFSAWRNHIFFKPVSWTGEYLRSPGHQVLFLKLGKPPFGYVRTL